MSVKEKPKKYWIGTVPNRDDFDRPIKSVFFDARTRTGTWAMMSHLSFYTYFGPDAKVGTGYAQKYVKQKDGRWLKTEG